MDLSHWCREGKTLVVRLGFTRQNNNKIYFLSEKPGPLKSSPPPLPPNKNSYKCKQMKSLRNSYIEYV